MEKQKKVLIELKEIRKEDFLKLKNKKVVRVVRVNLYSLTIDDGIKEYIINNYDVYSIFIKSNENKLTAIDLVNKLKINDNDFIVSYLKKIKWHKNKINLLLRYYNN